MLELFAAVGLRLEQALGVGALEVAGGEGWVVGTVVGLLLGWLGLGV